MILICTSLPLMPKFLEVVRRSQGKGSNGTAAQHLSWHKSTSTRKFTGTRITEDSLSWADDDDDTSRLAMKEYESAQDVNASGDARPVDARHGDPMEKV